MNPLRALLDLLYPPVCPFCGRVLERGEDRMCALCGLELPWADGPVQTVEGCDLCLSPLRYRGGVRRAVHRYKFRGVAGLSGLFGELMARCLSGRRDGTADLVTWVPLHPKRKKRRGYDQAELLARRAAELRGIPAVPTLEKIRLTGTQSRQNTGADRRANVEGAYRALPGLDLTGKRVVLVDDVVTTGSTLTQCAACLRSAGAAAVVGLTFARAGTEKRGEAGCEGAWTGARTSAGARSVPQASPRRRESDRASSPLRSVTTEKR